MCRYKYNFRCELNYRKSTNRFKPQALPILFHMTFVNTHNMLRIDHPFIFGHKRKTIQYTIKLIMTSLCNQTHQENPFIVHITIGWPFNKLMNLVNSK